MKTISLALLALSFVPVVPAQSLPSAPKIPGIPSVPTSLEDRRKALAQVTHDYWEDLLKRSPELASAVGDRRYNDQVTNYASGAYNDAISREQGYLMQLAVIDLAGFSDQEKANYESLEQRLEEDQKNVENKPWETPITSSAAFYAVYPRLAQTLPFATVKDYDDWTARLRLLPEAFAQAMQAMSIGLQDRRVPSKEVLEKALAEVTALGHEKPEDSPLAAPLKRLPSGISATEQERIKQEMVDAITNDADAAYLRLQRFLQASYLPAAENRQDLMPTREAQLLAAVLEAREKTAGTKASAEEIKAFHDKVLKAGMLPLDQFRQQLAADPFPAAR